MALNPLSVEIILCTFSFFDLKSLIVCRAVCQQWQKLVMTSDVSPPRRALFDLYIHIVSSPYFLQSRPWVLKNIRNFDRNAYLAALVDQHHYIPEEFRVWVLEWPARAAFGCIWPGLPSGYILREMADGVQLLEGANWLGYLPPVVSTMTWYNDGKEVTVPGILTFSSYMTRWLVLDEREELRGKVIEMEAESTIYTTETDDVDVVFKNWIDFLMEVWKRIERAASHRSHPTYRDEWDTLALDNPPKFQGIPWVNVRKPT